MTRYIDPKEKLFGHLERLGKLQAGRVPMPINIEIDLSNRCSLGCDWCHFAYTHTRGPLKGKRSKPAGAVLGGDLMDPLLARGIIDQFTTAGVKSVTWTGGGEPTLHPDFDGIISFAEGRLSQGIYTHGGHITDERAALLKRAMTFVYVSLDAADEDSYSRDKGVTAKRFHDACDGIRRLVAADGAAAVGVGYLVTEQNWRASAAAADLAAELGADYLQLRPTVHFDQANPGTPSEDTSWLDDALRVIENLQRRHDGFLVADLDRFRMYRGWDGHGYGTCWWSGLQSVVTPNGKMWTCVNKREHPAAEIGDLSVEPFERIWARHRLAKVDGSCRVMCRGHLPNLTVDELMTPRNHGAFV